LLQGLFSWFNLIPKVFHLPGFLWGGGMKVPGNQVALGFAVFGMNAFIPLSATAF